MQKFKEAQSVNVKWATRWDRENSRWIRVNNLERHYPFKFVGDSNMMLAEFGQVVAWCHERFPRKKLWHAEIPRIMFRNELDAFEFKMRWC
ncbi:MAG: hypothetical protein EOP83_11570 [Verrucomicrobiaceae bacterium]|nr:MAG: hypothetical protein EOP83_11570 [Verrucomicrobiaceae bacterium]